MSLRSSSRRMSCSVIGRCPLSRSTSATAGGKRRSSTSQRAATRTLGSLAYPRMWAMPREWNPITATLIRSFGLSCARTVRMAAPATAALPALDRKSRRVVRDIVFLKRLQAEGTVYRAFRQKEGLRTSLLSGLAELAVDLLLPLKELAQRLIFRATEQNVCGAFFEAVARLDLFWFPDDDLRDQYFPFSAPSLTPVPGLALLLAL